MFYTFRLKIYCNFVYLLDMDELWVHLQKFDSGPEKWQRLSQFWSSEKQPAIEIQNKKTERMNWKYSDKNETNEM